jgi:hypothetical protein
VNPARIAANFEAFDFELTADPIAALDGLNTGARGGPEPESVTPERSWSYAERGRRGGNPELLALRFSPQTERLPSDARDFRCGTFEAH